jgi:transcription termination/antitermination protein NusG
MKYFPIHDKNPEEEHYIKLVKAQLHTNPRRKLFPRRTLTIRKLGVTKTVQTPVFPGYVFLETESIAPETYWIFRRTDGFFRFLKSNQHVHPLSGADKRLLLHFISFGEVADKSIVTFDSNDRIVVLEGPLKNLEGFIVKVDRRKGRAKIRLSMCGDKFLIDLGFEAIERLVGGENKDAGRG